MTHTRFLFRMGMVFCLLALFACNTGDSPVSSKAPLKEQYSIAHRARSGIAHGGIGTGSVELRKDGQFYNWTIFNNQPLGTGPLLDLLTNPKNPWEESLQFFIVRYQEEGQEPKMKLLQLNSSLEEGGLEGIDYYFPWMTAVEKIEYSARFPFTWLTFTDREMPLRVELEVFSPFIPHDVKNSSLPGVYFNFNITSLTNKKVDVMILASQRNLVGYDTFDKYFVGNIVEREGFKFFEQTAGGMDTLASTYGQMGMASVSGESNYYIGWEHKHPYYEYLVVDKQLRDINDTGGRNSVDRVTGKKRGNTKFRTRDQRMFSSISLSKELPAKGSLHHSFVMSWYFPNNYGSYNDPQPKMDGNFTIGQKITKNQGHYYTNFFAGASEVAEYMIREKEVLTSRTRAFMDHLYASDLELFVLDQVNSQLNTLITSTVLTKDLKFGIREGLTQDQAWGPNNTSDVSLYASIMTLSLFPELQKSAMRCHRDLQTPRGEINHGLGFDLDYTQNGTWGVYERVDLPGNYIQMVLRDFFVTNDVDYLKEMWPSVKKAIQYILDERDGNGDQMPEMHGIMCSYDNFPMYGLASYIQSQWLASLTAASRVADILGEAGEMEKYRSIALKGSELMDQHLWNGKYYRLSNDYDGSVGNKGVDEGCLTDQVIGQWIAHQCGLGYLFDEVHVKKALASVMEMSFKPGFGLRNCSWPEHPELYPIHESNLWVDQANTCWTGVELGFAALLIHEGMVKEGLDVIRAVDNRYRRANLYFDHQEFGGHYLRPMSAWGIINAFLGLEINQGKFVFDPKLDRKEYTLFFAFPTGTAHYVKTRKGVEIRVLTGELNCSALVIRNAGLKSTSWKEIPTRVEGKEFVLDFGQPRVFKAGETISLL